MSDLYVIKATPYGGRGVFAAQNIPEGTLVHTSRAPYASVIYREYRKEVCAQCFLYAFDEGRSTWNTRIDGLGVWFCSEQCKHDWEREETTEGVNLTGQMNFSIEKLDRTMKKNKKQPQSPSKALVLPDPLTSEYIDLVWRSVEQNPQKPLHEPLNDLQLDMVRFLASAIIKRYNEDTPTAPRDYRATSGRWPEFMELQDNELGYVRSKPHILESHLQVYAFLRKAIVPVLRPYVETADIVRQILGRDQGNAFGIYEVDGDAEMLGYALYISGSYFNHNCSPSIKKQRIGREMRFFTTREVEEDEELCTNYIDIKDAVGVRQEQLSKNWYFDCTCQRCESELKTPGF